MPSAPLVTLPRPRSAERTQQNMRALEKAEHVRLSRAALHDQISVKSRAGGFKRIVELLEDPPDFILTMHIAALLRLVSGVGDSYARSILTHADRVGGPIFETRRVDELTERRRRALADHLYLTYVRGNYTGARFAQRTSARNAT